MKKAIIALFVLIFLITLYNFFISIYSLWHKRDVLIKANNELISVKKQNQYLKKQLNLAGNPEFIEEQARDKLLLVRPGENMVIIPQNLLPTATPPKKQADQIPNWQKWLHLFLHS